MASKGSECYWVVYHVEGFGERQAGSYSSYAAAAVEKQDIAGYAGVSSARIIHATTDYLVSNERNVGRGANSC
jgi:hypothetical protein